MAGSTIHIKIDATGAVTGGKMAETALRSVGKQAKTSTTETTGMVRAVQDLARATRIVEGPLGGAAARLQTFSATLSTGRSATVATTLAITAFATAIAGIAAAGAGMQELSNKLRVLGESGEGLSKLRGNLFKLARETSTDVNATVDLYSKLSQSLSTLGYSQQGVMEVTKAFSLATAASGGTAQSAAAATYQFAQAMRSGKFAGDEFKSMSENAPVVLDALAKQLGVTRGELALMSEQGALTPKVVADALGKALPDIIKRYEQMEQTVAQGTTNIRGSILRLFGEVNEKLGFSRDTAKGFNDIADAINRIDSEKFGKLLSGTTQLLGLVAGVALLRAGILPLINAYKAWAVAGTAVEMLLLPLQIGLAKVGGALGLLRAALIALPITAIISGFTYLTIKTGSLGGAFELLGRGAMMVFYDVTNGFAIMAQGILVGSNDIVRSINSMLAKIQVAGSATAGLIKSKGKSVFEWATQSLDGKQISLTEFDKKNEQIRLSNLDEKIEEITSWWAKAGGANSDPKKTGTYEFLNHLQGAISDKTTDNARKMVDLFNGEQKKIDGLPPLEAIKGSSGGISGGEAGKGSKGGKEEKAQKASIERQKDVIENYYDHALAEQDRYLDIVVNAGTRLEDALIQPYDNAKEALKGFGNFAAGVLQDIQRQVIKQNITAPLVDFFGGIVKGYFGGVSGNSIGSAEAGLTPMPELANLRSAKGNVFMSRQQTASRGIYAERGAEAILPLTRDNRGNLGVSTTGGSGNGKSIVHAPVYNIDARGAEKGVARELKNQLEQLQNNFDKKVIGAIQSASRNNPKSLRG
jgi:tape measure domain-containing protein